MAKPARAFQPCAKGLDCAIRLFQNMMTGGEHQKMEACFSPIDQSVTVAPHRDVTFVPLDQQSAGYAFSTVLYEVVRLISL